MVPGRLRIHCVFRGEMVVGVALHFPPLVPRPSCRSTAPSAPLGCTARQVAVENPRDPRVGEADRAGRTLRATGDAGTSRWHAVGTTGWWPTLPRRITVALPEGILTTIRGNGAPLSCPGRARGAHTVVP